MILFTNCMRDVGSLNLPAAVYDVGKAALLDADSVESLGSEASLSQLCHHTKARQACLATGGLNTATVNLTGFCVAQKQKS